MAERRAKYGNVRTERNGLVYDSRLEAEVAGVLDLLQTQGRISGYRRQVPFLLAVRRKGLRAVEYVADFVVLLPRGSGLETVIIESRGFEPAASRLKRRWCMDKYPEVRLSVVHAPQEVIGVIESLEQQEGS